MRLVLIDHYDSFTFNVIDWLERGGATVQLVAHDDLVGLARLEADPLPLVLSPGPRRPEDAPGTVHLVRQLLGRVPILGICLGHQILAHVAGARIVPGKAPFHGATRLITPEAGPAFKAALYNSLVVDAATLLPPWRVTARCEIGEIASISREVPGEAPAYGLQFHPESFLSEGPAGIRDAWLAKLNP